MATPANVIETPFATVARNPKDEGISTILGAILVVTVLVSIYFIYIVYGLPSFCASVEKKAFARVENQFVALDDAVRKTIADDTARTVEISMGGTYPTIPFVPTPPGYTGALQTTPGSVKIENVTVLSAEYVQPYTNPETSIKQNCSKLVYIPSYTYLQAPYVYYMYGMVFLAYDGKVNYLYGTFIQNHTIYLPLLYGNVSLSGNVPATLRLYPMSAGGKGILIENQPGKRITITLDVYMSQANPPQAFWNKTLSPFLPAGSTVTYDATSHELTITLPPGKYTLVGGIVSLQPDQHLKPDFLLPYTPTAQSTSPNDHVVPVSVCAVDKFGNPVPYASVTFYANYTNLYEATDPLTRVTSPYTTNATSTGVATCLANLTTSSNVGYVVASVRGGASPYEVPFVLTK